MSLLYLIRHGQAGTRDRYDCLSDLGLRQSRLLGAHLAREGVRFDSVWTGTLARQTQTAEAVLGALAEAGSPQPEPLVDARWNEFDLDGIYAAIAPQLAAHDPAFRRYYDSLQQALAAGQGEIHRRWTPADSAVVNAWIHGRYRFTGESWDGFVERVRAAGEAPLAAAAAGRQVAVFTSATPVSITLGRVLPLEASHIMQLTGAALNSNVTILHVNGERPSLFSFNSVPHLDRAELRTNR
ncbi:MAG: histidine phosphatase family protein [Bryobacteraceae bacterium]